MKKNAHVSSGQRPRFFKQVVAKLVNGVPLEEFEREFRNCYISPGTTAMQFLRTLRSTGELEEANGRIRYKVQSY